MEKILDSKLQALKNMANLYWDLVKKDYGYQYRLDGIYQEIEVLEELRDGKYVNAENWLSCYKEDVEEVK